MTVVAMRRTDCDRSNSVVRQIKCALLALLLLVSIPHELLAQETLSGQFVPLSGVAERAGELPLFSRLPEFEPGQGIWDSFELAFDPTAAAVTSDGEQSPESGSVQAFKCDAATSVNADDDDELIRRITALENAIANDNQEGDDQSDSATGNRDETKNVDAAIAVKLDTETNGKNDADKKAEEFNDKTGEPPQVPLDKWDVKLGGHVQMDYITWANADPAIDDAINYFNYRRLRLVANGVGYGNFDFRLQLTLEPGPGSNESPFGSPDVKDAYLSMNEIPHIGRFRAGNFFVPFGLEQVTNDTNNIFNERSIPTQGIFTADREVGIAVYNCTPDQNVTWTIGLFFDDISDAIKTRFDDNQGLRLSGRLTWLPYYDEPTNGRYLIHTGVGILHTDNHDDRVRFSARPQVQRGPILIDSGFLVADSYTTGNTEFAVVWGRVTLQSEAFLSSVNSQIGDSIVVGGAYSHLSYFLTGENRVFERFGQHGPQFGRNIPFKNFSLTPCCRGPGAWEAKVRWSWLDLNATDSGQYNDISAGFNWYLSDRTRVMFDWIHPFTTSDTVFGTTSSDLLAMRLDVNW